MRRKSFDEMSLEELREARAKTQRSMDRCFVVIWICIAISLACQVIRVVGMVRGS